MQIRINKNSLFYKKAVVKYLSLSADFRNKSRPHLYRLFLTTFCRIFHNQTYHLLQLLLISTFCRVFGFLKFSSQQTRLFLLNYFSEDLNPSLLAEKNCLQSSISLQLQFFFEQPLSHIFSNSYFNNFIAFSFFQSVCHFIVKSCWY